jgi:methylthioribose-1-phosphate isomerase
MTWQEKFTQVVQDKQSGATVLSAATARALLALAEEAEFATQADLFNQIETSAELVLAAQTGLAPLVALYNRVLFAVGAETSLEAARTALQGTARAHLADMEHANSELSRRAVALMPHGLAVCTHSASSTVLTALKRAAQAGRSISVICQESRPGGEGRILASELAAAGVAVTITVDSAMAENVRACEMVVLGAESLSEKGLIAKLGTSALASCAKWAGVPCYVLADTTKIWPTALGPQLLKERPAEEVWDAPPPGVKVLNRYYDITAWDAISGVVTEQGLLNAKEVRDLSRQRTAHPLLQRIIARIGQQS